MFDKPHKFDWKMCVAYLQGFVQLACIAAGLQYSVVGDCIWPDVPIT